MHWKKLTNVKDSVELMYHIQNKLEFGNTDYHKMQSQHQLQRF